MFPALLISSPAQEAAELRHAHTHSLHHFKSLLLCSSSSSSVTVEHIIEPTYGNLPQSSYELTNPRDPGPLLAHSQQ